MKNKNGETSLHVAAQYGHPHVIDHLCKLGGNVDCQDDVSQKDFFLLNLEYMFGF